MAAPAPENQVTTPGDITRAAERPRERGAFLYGLLKRLDPGGGVLLHATPRTVRPVRTSNPLYGAENRCFRRLVPSLLKRSGRRDVQYLMHDSLTTGDRGAGRGRWKCNREGAVETSIRDLAFDY